MELGFTDKHVLVTGGAGGLGEEIIQLLYQAGAKVSLHFNTNRENAVVIQERCNKERVKLIQGDLRDEQQVQALFSSAITNFGRIDHLVANAAIGSNKVLTSELSLQQWNNTINTNLTSVFLCVREFFKNLEEYPGRNGSIVLIGSTAGEVGEAGHADYSASKAALMYGLTKTWKNEIIHYASQGRVNTVAPGWFLTKMSEESLKDENTLKTIIQTIPLAKIAAPNEVASTAVFLLSDRVSSHISGETLMIHGGMEGRVLHKKEDLDLSFINSLKKK
ncbi:MAG: SDR family oxidoreductase [Candidatus Heimdallarchaeota archaeon]|nr:SDR family oxidoreductase [Candidatus Heimdallarchaeota archaeon]MCK4954124.1 SDR family oxidoreductase [Candidatus Heimdallarchaeota archaeon]